MDIVPPVVRACSPPTVFESMLYGSVSCTAIYSDEICGAIVDANPQAPYHFVIFPRNKEGLARLHELDIGHTSVVGHLIYVAKLLSQQYGMANDGCRLVINDGPIGGQTVPHLSVHLLGGRQLSWPPG